MRPAALALVVLVHSPAQADEARNEEPLTLEDFQVTASRQEQSAFDVSAGVTVVGRAEVERQMPRILPDLLRGQTGVFVQQTTPGQGAAIIRGLKGSEILHLVDGMRLNNAFFRNAPTQYLALVDAQHVERLEIVRGPSSTLYGSDAMGGVVQLITPTPDFTEAQWTSRWQASGELGTAESLRAGRLAVEAGREGIALAAGVSYVDVGDRRAGTGIEQRPSAYIARGGNAKLVLRPDEERELLVSLQFMEQPETPRFDELVSGFGQAVPASEVFNFEPNRRFFAHTRYRAYDSAPFIDRVELSAAFQRIDDDRRSRDFGAADEASERNRSDLWGLTLQATTELARHRVSYGAEVYLDEVSSSRTSTDIATGESENVQSRFPDGSRMDSYAVYVNDEMDLGERLSFTAGARLSYFDIELPAADRGVGASLDLEDLTGEVGISYALKPGLHLVANIGRGFRPPNVFDLGTLGERPGNRFNVANPDLQPESVITSDVGVKFRGDRLRGELLLYHADYRDKITSIETGEITEDGRIVVQNRNVNELVLRGVEFGARYRASAEAELFGNFTWTWGEEEFPDGRVAAADRIPPLNGRIGVLFHPRGEYWAEAYLQFSEEQDRLSERDRSDPRVDPAGTPGWATLGLRLGWEAPMWRLTLRLDNLLDRAYREHGSGIDAPGFDAGVSVTARF